MDLKDLKVIDQLYQNKDIEQLKKLAKEVREFLNDFVNKNNGHIGSNLGVVELTICLCVFFNLKKTMILFDTGHQSHVFKLLIHGKEKFKTIKTFNGLSNFQEFQESQYDWISTGHSSTSLAYLMGYTKVSDKENFISVIGDASFLGSYTLPSLLNLQNCKKNTIVILNDNNQSIGPTVLKINDLKSYVNSLGWDYIKCDNGNDFEQLFLLFDQIKDNKKNIFLHCITKKAFNYHGEKPLFCNHSIEENIESSYSNLIAKEIENYFTDQDYLISPAMLFSSHFDKLKEKFQNNVIDVGINEEVSVLMANAIANCQKKVFVSIYATFFQRTFDQLVHDVFRNNNNVNFLIDRGGLSYGGGVSHHGIYDISLINNFSNAIICQPYSINDLKNMVKQAYFNNNGPFFLRCENLKAVDLKNDYEFKIGQWEQLIYNKEYKISIISYGKTLQDFYNYIVENDLKINLINARYINPIDIDVLEIHKNNWIFVYEQVINKNNLYTNIKTKFENLKIKSFAFNKTNIKHGQKQLVLKDLKMDVETVIKEIFEEIEKCNQ